MKHLPISSPNYIYLLSGFTQWLDTLGYAGTSITMLPQHVRELLHYLEQKRITHITQVKERHISDFASYLKGRSNLKHGGGLSSSHINTILQAITTFARYLNQTGTCVLDATPKRLVSEVDERTILTKEEIMQLYEATFAPHRHNSIAMGQRDRAIIAILYGCGLRKDEASKLNITDIDLIHKLTFVRKGKGNKQRYVPIANKHAEDIRAYIEEGRGWFLENHYQSAFIRSTGKSFSKKKNTHDEAFFLNGKGQRMQSFYSRLDYLKAKAGIDKQFSTHNLRHSIATHLLQNGMALEQIAKFLGHASLESTQIYTHIVHLLESKTHEPASV